MGQGDQCIFCQLIDNPDQLMLVGETDNFYAWLEINPRSKGHTMVVPKEHKESLLDFSPEDYQEAMKLTRMVIEKAKEGIGADGASVTVNIGESGGQMVPHAYIQVFPRFEDEENAGTPTGAIFPQREDLQPQLEDIQGEMASVSVDFGEKQREAHPESKKHRDRSSSRGSRLVDRKEMEKGGKKEPEKKEKKENPEPEQENQETEDTREPDAAELLEDGSHEQKEKQEDDEEEEGPVGEGHWDGKSFEWR